MFRGLIILSSALFPFSAAQPQSGALLVTDSTGTSIGRLVSLERGDLTIITPRGYLVYLRGRTGEIISPNESGGTAYLSADCSGQPFAKAIYLKPLVFLSGWNAAQAFEVMFVRENASQTTLLPGDTYYQWVTLGPNPNLVCFGTQLQVGDDPVRLTPMFPNEPDETGIGNGPFVPPFKVSAVELYRNGFEKA